MQIILLETDDSLRSLLKLNIMKSIGCDVIEKDNVADALSLLQILPDIDLVICRSDKSLKKEEHEIFQYLINQNQGTPLLLIGDVVTNYKHTVSLDPAHSWKKVVAAAGKILGVEVAEDDNRFASDYVPVGIHYFYNINSSSMGCDIYIRVKKGDEYQYIKRLHASDQFTRADIEKYKEAGLKEFYIIKEHFTQFVDFVTSQLVLKLDDASLQGTDRVSVTAEAFDISLERIHSLGIDGNTIEIVTENIKSMESSLKEKSPLTTFLQAMKKNKLSYAYSHTYLCSIILHQVIKQFDWGSPQMKEKLTYIAFFHDISLSENNSGRINNEIELENLSEKERKRMMNHALDSSIMVEKFPNVPNGVGAILKEHHGSKNGIGFPDTLSIAINPLSMMFIVVEHFVDEFLMIKGNVGSEDMKKIFAKLGEHYQKATYLQTLQALQKMTGNGKASE